MKPSLNHSTFVGAILFSIQAFAVITIDTPSTKYINDSNKGAFSFNGKCNPSKSTTIKSSVGTKVVETNFVCGSTGYWNKTLNVSTLPDGNVTAGLHQSGIASVYKTFKKDVIRPALKVTAPVANSLIDISNYQALNMTGTCSENLAKVYIHFYNTQNVKTALAETTCNAGSWTTTANTSAVQNASSVRFYYSHGDLAGNWTAVNVYLNKNIMAPPPDAPPVASFISVDITFPMERSYKSFIYSTNLTFFEIAGSCIGEGLAIKVKANGTEKAATSCSNKSWSAKLDLSGYADGDVSVAAEIYDSAGNISETSIKKYVKNEAGQHYWVEGTAGSDAWEGSSSRPFKNIYKAISKALPGDVIHVLPKLDNTAYNNVWISNKNGLPGKLITIQGEGENVKAKIAAWGNDAQSVHIEHSSYIAVRNFDVSNYTKRNCILVNGIKVGNTYSASHHIEVTDNFVHDCPNGGISAVFSDYLFFSYNQVTRTSRDTTEAWHSGISIYGNKYVDTYTGVKNIIRNNIVHDVLNVPAPLCKKCSNSDGSGIIIDDLRNLQHATSTDYLPPYIYGQTLIENNVSYNNGGRGISVFSSYNTIIRNNTAYENNKDPYEGSWRPGEIMAVMSINIEIYNNVAYSDGLTTVYTPYSVNTGAHVGISVQESQNVKVNNNLSFNRQNNPANHIYQRYNTNTLIDITSERWGHPMFSLPGLTGITDFRLKSGSPGLNMISTGKGAADDMTGRARRSPISAGAYQYPGL